MKKEKSQQILQKNKKNMRILWTITCQQIWRPRRNGQLSRDLQSAKMNQEEIDQLNRLITRKEIKYIIKILPTNKNMYKINIQKSVAFLYTNNEILEKEYKNTILLYAEKYETIIKEIKEY